MSEITDPKTGETYSFYSRSNVGDQALVNQFNQFLCIGLSSVQGASPGFPGGTLPIKGQAPTNLSAAKDIGSGAFDPLKTIITSTVNDPAVMALVIGTGPVTAGIKSALAPIATSFT